MNAAACGPPVWLVALVLAGGAPAAPSVERPAAEAAAPGDAERSVAAYEVPPVKLLDQHGQPVELAALLGGPQPVALSFIFTSCRTICPVLSASLAHLRREIGARAPVRYVSITIDPEFDTPSVLRDYARRFGAGSDWTFLTGRAEDILVVQRAFEAYVGDKNGHRPLTLVRPGPGSPWVRFDGFASTERLIGELLGERH